MGISLFWRDKLGNPDCPYITRWVLDLGRLGSLRLHHWYGNDDQRALHNHPWGFLTVVLSGSYVDVHEPTWLQTHGTITDEGFYKTLLRHDILRAGSIRWRRANHTHTVETTGAWTILWCQPKSQYFSFRTFFHGKMKWVRHVKYFHEFGHPACS